MCGWFAGTFCWDFDWILHIFGTPIVVDSSFVLILVNCPCLHLYWLVPRGNFVYPSVLSTPLTLPRECEVVSNCLCIFLTIASILLRTRKGDRACQANAVGYQLHGKEKIESTHFYNTLEYTTTDFGAFGYVPGKKRTLCGQCERKTQETLDAQPTHKKLLSDGEHGVQW